MKSDERVIYFYDLAVTSRTEHANLPPVRSLLEVISAERAAGRFRTAGDRAGNLWHFLGPIEFDEENQVATILVKSCGHLSHGDLQSCEVDHSSVALIGFLVSGGDPPECFEAAEEVLDEVPPAISVKVAFDLLLSVRFGRDHRYSASFVQLGSQPVCVESLVSEEHIEFDVLD